MKYGLAKAGSRAGLAHSQETAGGVCQVKFCAGFQLCGWPSWRLTVLHHNAPCIRHAEPTNRTSCSLQRELPATRGLLHAPVKHSEATLMQVQ